MIHIKEALTLFDFFYPKFVETNGVILLASALPTEEINSSNFSDKTELECFYNHVHILDHFLHKAALDGNDSEKGFWDEIHPDFRVACDVGKKVAFVWQRILKQEFPEYRFRVYYTEADNPTVRFHRVREGEANWLAEEDWLNDIAKEKVIVYDTGK